MKGPAFLKSAISFATMLYVKYYQQLFFYKGIWSSSAEQTSFEIQSSLKSINFTVDADGKVVFPLLV